MKKVRFEAKISQELKDEIQKIKIMEEITYHTLFREFLSLYNNKYANATLRKVLRKKLVI